MLRRTLVVLVGLLTLLTVPLAVPALAANTNTGLVHQATLYAQQHHAQIAEAIALGFGWLASHATAFLTHENAPPRFKTTIVTVLSVLGAVVSTVVWSDGEPWYLWVKDIAFALMASQGSYLLRDLPVLGSAALQSRGLTLGDPEKANPTDPSVFPGADGSLWLDPPVDAPPDTPIDPPVVEPVAPPPGG